MQQDSVIRKTEKERERKLFYLTYPGYLLRGDRRERERNAHIYSLYYWAFLCWIIDGPFCVGRGMIVCLFIRNLIVFLFFSWLNRIVRRKRRPDAARPKSPWWIRSSTNTRRDRSPTTLLKKPSPKPEHLSRYCMHHKRHLIQFFNLSLSFWEWFEFMYAFNSYPTINTEVWKMVFFLFGREKGISISSQSSFLYPISIGHAFKWRHGDKRRSQPLTRPTSSAMSRFPAWQQWWTISDRLFSCFCQTLTRLRIKENNTTAS